MAFAFYDTETSSLHTAHAQILQFAAVLTDDQLNEVDQFEIRSRLLPYVVPSPSAMLVNRISARDLIDVKYPSHYGMMQRIREKLLSWSPAVFVGFNSLGFDEHLLRQAFYKTLHPIYLTNTSGNNRCDAMRVLAAASIFAPNAISVPTSETNRRTFRLDRVARANGFDQGNAHDAMCDVQATIHLCRRLANRAPNLWSSAIRLSRKTAILDFIETEPVFGLTDFYFGRPYSRIVTAIGNNERNPNEIYVYNLALAPEYIGALSEARLLLRMPTRPRIVHAMRANAGPILTRLDETPALVQGRVLGPEELQRRADGLRTDADLRARLIAAFEATRASREPSPHIEEQIYDGFFGDADHLLLGEFHAVPWEERLAIVERFEDGRLRGLGYRLVYSERSDLLDEAARQAHSDRIMRNLLGLDGEVPWLTLRDAIQEANDLLKSAKGADLGFIREHRDALQQRLAEAMRLITKDGEAPVKVPAS